MAGKKVLITGMSGLIGGALRERLASRYELSALNRSPVAGVPCHRADISDLEAILPAFEGRDLVVHLAAIAKVDATIEEVMTHNILGTYNVFEASRRAGVKRVVFASTGATVANIERDMPYKALVSGEEEQVPAEWEILTHESPVRPRGLYGCSKVWGEALARYFVDNFGMSIICLRIGAVPAADRPTQPRMFSAWCSQRDIVTLLQCCMEAPESLKFDIFFGVSNNRLSYRDMAHPRQVLGFTAQDSADDYR